MEKNKKILGVIVIIIAIIVVIGAAILIDMNKKKIAIPEEYTLESNESGVVTYANNLDNGYKLEVKEDTNPNGIKKEDMYGSIMKCNVDGKDYIITCYNPVDKSREVAPADVIFYDVSDIKAHPGVKPVQCAHKSDQDTFPSIMKYTEYPYDLKTLYDMNETGNLNASSIQQYFPPTYMDACDEIKERDNQFLIDTYPANTFLNMYYSGIYY